MNAVPATAPKKRGRPSNADIAARTSAPAAAPVQPARGKAKPPVAKGGKGKKAC